MTTSLPAAATDPLERERLAAAIQHRTGSIRSHLHSLCLDWPNLLTQPASTGRSSGASESRTPISAHRLSLAESIPRVLAKWCEITVDVRGLRAVSLQLLDAPAMAAWLLPHAEWLALLEHDVEPGEQGDDGVSVERELREAATAVRTAVEPTGTKRIDVCACPMPARDSAEATCPGRVNAIIRLDDDEHYATCDVDADHTWHQDAWPALAEHAGQRLPAEMTASALAAWMSTHYRASINDGMIRKWSHRHRDFPPPHYRTGLWPRFPIALWYLDHRTATSRAA